MYRKIDLKCPIWCAHIIEIDYICSINGKNRLFFYNWQQLILVIFFDSIRKKSLETYFSHFIDKFKVYMYLFIKKIEPFYIYVQTCLKVFNKLCKMTV